MTTVKVDRWHPRRVLASARTHSPPHLVGLAQETAAALTRVDPFDRAMTLAAQAFTSLFPLVMVTATSLGPQSSTAIGDRIADRLSLPPQTRSVLEAALVPQSSPQSTAFGILGVLIVFLSATSFARALARMYSRAWQKQPSGWRGGWRWLAVIVAVTSCALGLQTTHRAAQGQLLTTVGSLLLTLAVNALLWTWVPWLLLARRVPWKSLVPGGVLMGFGSVGTLLASHVYLPRALTTAARDFGAFGVAFTYIGWLFVIAFVLIVTTVLGAVLVQGDAPESKEPSGASANM